MLFFSSRRRHTRYWRDWSSDVCSSDLRQAIEDSGANIEVQQVTTGAELPEERSRIEAWYNGHKDVAGMFAVDAGSTQGVAQVMEQFGLAEQGVRAGGDGPLPGILGLL